MGILYIMSYKNVFYGTIGPLTFYSREGDILDGTEMRKYLPEDFLIDIFYKGPTTYFGISITISHTSI